jgi:hypothetical protein
MVGRHVFFQGGLPGMGAGWVQHPVMYSDPYAVQEHLDQMGRESQIDRRLRVPVRHAVVMPCQFDVVSQPNGGALPGGNLQKGWAGVGPQSRLVQLDEGSKRLPGRF